MKPETKPSLSVRIFFWLRGLRDVAVSSWDSLPSLLSKLWAPLQEFIDLITAKDGTGKKREGPPIKPLIVSEIAPPPPNDRPERRKYAQTPWWKTVLEFAAVILLTIYTLETRKTNTLTQQALNDERLHFSKIQRPWVGTTGDFTLSDSQENGWPIFVMSYRLRNFGAAPAMNIVAPLWTRHRGREQLCSDQSQSQVRILCC